MHYAVDLTQQYQANRSANHVLEPKACSVLSASDWPAISTKPQPANHNAFWLRLFIRAKQEGSVRVTFLSIATSVLP